MRSGNKGKEVMYMDGLICKVGKHGEQHRKQWKDT